MFFIQLITCKLILSTPPKQTVHQFGTISRQLRLLVALSYSLSTTESTNNNKHQQSNTSGSNALQRQLLKTTTTLLLLCPPSIPGKEMAKLLHSTVIEMVHDVRPKVRKGAWGCAMEIIIVANSSSSDGAAGEDDGTEDTKEEQTKLQMQMQSHRKCLADMLWEYCFAVLTAYSSSSNKAKGSKGKSKGNENANKLIHVLRFLETSLAFADDERICVKFGEGCLSLLEGGDGGAVTSMEVVRETLLTLLACLEKADKTSGGKNEELTKFASRALAFLLQNRPNSGVDSLSAAAGDVFVVYGRCLLGCMGRMVGTDTDDSSNEVPPSKLLAMKLLPNVLRSMLHLCEAPSGGGDGGSDNAETCASEFNQFVSRVMPMVISCACGKNRHNKQLHRVALETLPQCIPIMQQVLQIQYRNAWGSILSGGYATFNMLMAVSLLELQGSDDKKSDLETKLQSWIKSMVLSLLRLRQDVEKDGTARNAVEYATLTIIRGMGLELFISLVDFLDDDSDELKSNKSLSTTTGGGIRDDRAWLLPLMKQAAPSTSLDQNSAATVFTAASTTKSHLSFFQGRVLNLARRCDAASADGHRTAAEASIQKARVIELWVLFPAFCVCPMDMKENFAALAKTVVKALGDHSRYPKIIVSTHPACVVYFNQIHVTDS